MYLLNLSSLVDALSIEPNSHAEEKRWDKCEGVNLFSFKIVLGIFYFSKQAISLLNFSLPLKIFDWFFIYFFININAAYVYV